MYIIVFVALKEMSVLFENLNMSIVEMTENSVYRSEKNTIDFHWGV